MKRPKRKYRHLLHILVWVYGIVLINIPYFGLTVGSFNASDHSLIVPSIYGTFFNALVFYGNWKFLLEQLDFKKWRYWGVLLALLFLISLVESMLDSWYLINYFSKKKMGFWASIFMDNLLFHLIFFLLPSYGFWYYGKYVTLKKDQQKLQEQKLQAELSLMRSQINPHFLFNVLNNLFASAQGYGDLKTAHGISNLAEMMRYMLYESSANKVSLEKELLYIKDFIELQRLRFSESDAIQITYSHQILDAASIEIAPMLFLPFIENAFKHGISLEKPSHITIAFSRKADTLFFSCANSIHEKGRSKPEDYAGFGLKNIGDRLKLLYPGQYKLTHAETTFEYQVRLALNIKY